MYSILVRFDYCENKCIEKGIDPNTLRTDFGASKESRKPDRGQGRNARKPERDYRHLFKITGVKPDSEWSPIRVCSRVTTVTTFVYYQKLKCMVLFRSRQKSTVPCFGLNSTETGLDISSINCYWMKRRKRLYYRVM